jgi:Phospholipid N-methyltransferase
LTFFGQWLRNPRSMASVTPSGRQLARLMATAMPPGSQRVVELGAGTGAITDALLRHGIQPQALLAVEMNPMLHRLLQQRFPGTHVACGDARHLHTLVHATHTFAPGQVDVVCSSLGLLTMPRDLQHDILTAAFQVLHPQGVFIQYTYGPTTRWMTACAGSSVGVPSRWPSLKRLSFDGTLHFAGECTHPRMCSSMPSPSRDTIQSATDAGARIACARSTPHFGESSIGSPMPPQTINVSVVSPIYGCRSCLENLVDRISNALTPLGATYEIILIDDASPDEAWARICEITTTHTTVRGLRLSRNFGQHAAIAAGLQYARGDKIIVMDCDLQDLPEEIPQLLAALHGETDVVLAQRGQRQDSPLKRLGSWGFYRVLGWLTDGFHDHTVGNFGAYSRKVIDVINRMPETDRFFPLLVRWTGFRTACIPVGHGRREEGRSGYTLRKLLNLAMNVAMAYSDKPLRLVIRLGLFFALLALCVVGTAIWQYLAGDTRVAGFTSIIASIWLVGSVAITCLGIIGLYLGRLFTLAKGRPHFIIAQDTSDPAR